MQTADLLILHALVITQNDRREVIEDGAVAVSGSAIAAVGSSAELAPQFHAFKTIDARGRALFPGLVNTHTHLFQAAVKGLGEDMAVEQWVQAVTFPTAVAMSAEETYLAALVSCLENLRSGATTVVDFMYPVGDPALHEAVLRAMLDSGLRGRYSRMVNDYGEKWGVPPALIHRAEACIEHACELKAKFDGAGNGRLRLGLSLGVIWGTTEAGMRAVRRCADETGLPITMHINETAFDNQAALEQFGRPTVPMLECCGLFGPDLLAVHCVHMAEEDIDTLARYRVPVSYNPVSNMYLGSGIAPILQMEKAGLPIGLGTDGAGSNNSQDMLEVLKFGALLQKVAAQDASAVRAQQALDWATRGGAEALQMGAAIGSVEVGKQADFFLVDSFTPKATPVHDPIATLVYSAGEANVVTTVVDGKVLLEDGVFRHLDEPAILREAQKAAQSLAKRAGTERLLEGRARWRPV